MLPKKIVYMLNLYLIKCIILFLSLNKIYYKYIMLLLNLEEENIQLNELNY